MSLRIEMMVKRSIRSALICALSICLLAPVRNAAGPSTDNCKLPRSLGEELSKKFPGTHVVSISDLDEYDRKLFRKDHDSRCPGIVKVDFFGDGKPTYAVVLIAGENPKRTAELIVGRLTGEAWEIRSLEKTDGTPVVWRESPGKYEGMYEESQTIQAKYPVIVFCGYGSWSILYSWTGKDVVKTWLSD